MKKLIVLHALLLISSPARALDHLLPEESLFTGMYHEKALSLLSSRLSRMYGPHAFANAVVLPSFSREYVVVFEKSGDEYTLVCMQTKQSIGAYQRLEELKAGTFLYSSEEETERAVAQLEAKLPKNYMDVEAEIVEIEINEDLGRELYDVWGKMLYRTQYPSPDELTPDSYPTFAPGQDGIMYHFSFFHRGVSLSGWIWGPPTDGLVKKFVAITTEAKTICESQDANVDSRLSKKVRALAADIKAAEN